MIGGLILAFILWLAHVIPGHSRGATASNTTATDAPAPVIVTTPLPPSLERDPPGRKWRTFGPGSSVEFFSGRLVVAIGAIRPFGPGEWMIDRVVLRSAAGGHCDEGAGLAGSAWGLKDESGHSYRIDLRGLAKGHAGFVAYTARSTANDHPGPAECMELFAAPLP